MNVILIKQHLCCDHNINNSRSSGKIGFVLKMTQMSSDIYTIASYHGKNRVKTTWIHGPLGLPYISHWILKMYSFSFYPPAVLLLLVLTQIYLHEHVRSCHQKSCWIQKRLNKRIWRNHIVAQNVGRVLHRRIISNHTSALTLWRSRISAQSAGWVVIIRVVS